MTELSFNNLINKLEEPIKRASEKILNLTIHQIGEEKMLSFKESLEHINMRFHISSSAEPLLSKHWYQELPKHIKDIDIVLPILAHGILRPDHSGFSKNNYFGGMLHVIQKNRDNRDIDDCFREAGTYKVSYNSITSHYPSRVVINQELRNWLKSEDIAIMSTKIDTILNNYEATRDLCEAMDLLQVNNQYLDCIRTIEGIDKIHNYNSDESKLLCGNIEILEH